MCQAEFVIGIVEALTPARVMARLNAEVTGITETLTPARAMNRLKAEVVGITENIIRFKTVIMVVDEAMGVVESLLKILDDSTSTLLLGAVRLYAAVSGTPVIRGAVSAAVSLKAAVRGTPKQNKDLP